MRTVLFDLFGTLVPCYPLRRLPSIFEEMALDVGVSRASFEAEWTRSFPNRLRGEFASVEDCLIHVLERLGAIYRHDAVYAAAQRRIAFERAALSPRPEAITALGGLRSMGVRIGVVSNCSVETVQAWPDCILARYVDHAAFSCVVRADKPEPAIYMQALATLGSSAGECLFVGDGSSNELAGAERLGMQAILIRADDDDGTFPGRIDPSDWHGPAISRLSEVTAFLERFGSA
jgi:putative hydrolase of the HAD superfamily